MINKAIEEIVDNVLNPYSPYYLTSFAAKVLAENIKTGRITPQRVCELFSKEMRSRFPDWDIVG